MTRTFEELLADRAATAAELQALRATAPAPTRAWPYPPRGTEGVYDLVLAVVQHPLAYPCRVDDVRTAVAMAVERGATEQAASAANHTHNSNVTYLQTCLTALDQRIEDARHPTRCLFCSKPSGRKFCVAGICEQAYQLQHGGA